MKRLSDDELIKELEERFAFNQKALCDLREMTEKLELMNSKLQESESLKGHFLSNIRNEINNPLTSIMGLSQQCLCSQSESERCITTAKMIYHEAFSLDFQLQNIFVAAELEAGEVNPAFARVDIPTIIDRVVEALEYQINEKQVTVKTNCAEPLVFSTDARMVRLILINLLGNAVEFGADGGRVDVSARSDDNILELVISDNGEGIPKDDQETIFDRFRQLDSGTTKSHRGHGLGLSIVRVLVEMLGGVLRLESDRSKGCVVSITLPQPDVEVQDVAREGNLFIFNDTEQF